MFSAGYCKKKQKTPSQLSFFNKQAYANNPFTDKYMQPVSFGIGHVFINNPFQPFTISTGTTLSDTK